MVPPDNPKLLPYFKVYKLDMFFKVFATIELKLFLPPQHEHNGSQTRHHTL